MKVFDGSEAFLGVLDPVFLGFFCPPAVTFPRSTLPESLTSASFLSTNIKPSKLKTLQWLLFPGWLPFSKFCQLFQLFRWKIFSWVCVCVCGVVSRLHALAKERCRGLVPASLSNEESLLDCSFDIVMLSQGVHH